MTNRDLFELQQALERVSDLPGSKFAYAVVKNKNKIKSITDALRREKRHPREEEYEKCRVEICERHCDRDDDDNPILKHNAFQGLQGNADFDADIDKLHKKFKDVMKYRQEEKTAFNARLDEEVEIEIHKIAFEGIPGDITANQLQGVMPIVLDPPV